MTTLKKNSMIVFKLVKRKLLSWLRRKVSICLRFCSFQKNSKVSLASTPTSCNDTQDCCCRRCAVRRYGRRRRLTSTHFLKKVLRSDKDDISFSFSNPINRKNSQKSPQGYERTNSMNTNRWGKKIKLSSLDRSAFKRTSRPAQNIRS